ncbi:MAG: DUF721 domain-containing protein [Flavobacteriaceae bacterium]|nr:DUF721 domain-containing protein [Flavobacteriaceae bacterium]
MSKRHNEHISLSDALKDFVETNNLQKGLDKIEVRDSWIKLMGKGVNSYTTAIQLQRDTLYVQLSSSVLREELSYGKEKIINMLNEDLGKEVIKKLILR